MSTLFKNLGLNDELLSAISDLGYETPSDIQTQTIPLILDGSDVVGLSQTGSGKTAAFSLPLLQKLEYPINSPQVLVVCPTRELSQQVAKAIEDFAKKSKGVRVANLYGGAPYPEQLHQLRQKPAVIVGTPGRLQDHLRRKSFPTDEIQAVVLDEADRMLDMGFRDEIKELLSEMPDDRQNIFFSATINPEIKKLIARFSNDAETVQVSGKVQPARTITQSWIDVRESSKLEVLRRLIMRDQPKQAVIFCNTKRRVEEAADALGVLGVTAERLHGDMGQPMRERVIKRFHEGHVRLLIATDVAGRGLDVAGIEAVYVLEMSHEPEDYVHRVGRTGRAGRSGIAFSLVSRRDFRYLKNVERYIGEKVTEVTIPSHEDLVATHEKSLVKKLLKEMDIAIVDGETPELNEDGEVVNEAKGVEISNFVEFMASAEQSELEAVDVIESLFSAWKNDTSPALNTIPEDRTGGKLSGEDRDRDFNKPKRERSDNKDYQTLFVGMGREDDINPGQITGMFYNECGLPEGSIGKINLYNRHSLVDIKKDAVDRVLSTTINFQNRRVPVRPDREQGGGGGGRRSGGGDYRQNRGGSGARRDRQRKSQGGGGNRRRERD